MPITRKGPGNPGKVASKMTKTSTGRLKNALTTLSNKMKAEQAGRDQVKKYKESLKQQKLAEQKAQKDLQLKERGGKRGKMSVSKEVKVTGKSKPTYERGKSMKLSYSTSKGGSTYYATPGGIKKDSAEFMNQLKTASPAAYEMAVKYMKSEQSKSPGSRFQFGSTPVIVDQYAVKKGTGRPKYVSGTDKRFVAYNPTITTLNKKKSGKKQ